MPQDLKDISDIFTSTPAKVRTAKYCDLPICMCICPFACIYHVQTSRNFLGMLSVAAAGDNAICYVFPVLWTTSYFHIMDAND